MEISNQVFAPIANTNNCHPDLRSIRTSLHIRPFRQDPSPRIRPQEDQHIYRPRLRLHTTVDVNPAEKMSSRSLQFCSNRNPLKRSNLPPRPLPIPSRFAW